MSRRRQGRLRACRGDHAAVVPDRYPSAPAPWGGITGGAAWPVGVSLRMVFSQNFQLTTRSSAAPSDWRWGRLRWRPRRAPIGTRPHHPLPQLLHPVPPLSVRIGCSTQGDEACLSHRARSPGHQLSGFLRLLGAAHGTPVSITTDRDPRSLRPVALGEQGHRLVHLVSVHQHGRRRDAAGAAWARRCPSVAW